MSSRKAVMRIIVFLLFLKAEFGSAKRQLPIGNTSVQCHSERWGQLCPNGCLLCNIKFLVTSGAREGISKVGAHVTSTRSQFEEEDERIRTNDATVIQHQKQIFQNLTQLKNETSLSLSLSNALQGSHTQLESELDILETRYRRINEKLKRIERNLIKKAATCATTQTSCTLPALSGRDCAEIYRAGGRSSGVYVIKPMGAGKPIRTICDMEDSGGGWTVIQKRFDGSLSFDRTWREYKSGFDQGSCDEIPEMWIGNENLHRLTHQANQQLKVVITSWHNDTRYARYRHFQIGNEESGYRMMAVDGYRSDPRGDVGDAFREFSRGRGDQRRLVDHLGARFTTHDVDNDNYVTNCAARGNGGWWYRGCAAVNLNGGRQNPNSRSEQHNARGLNGHGGIIWRPWTDRHGSLRATTMKIRPTRY